MICLECVRIRAWAWFWHKIVCSHGMVSLCSRPWHGCGSRSGTPRSDNGDCVLVWHDRVHEQLPAGRPRSPAGHRDPAVCWYPHPPYQHHGAWRLQWLWKLRHKTRRLDEWRVEADEVCEESEVDSRRRLARMLWTCAAPNADTCQLGSWYKEGARYDRGCRTTREKLCSEQREDWLDERSHSIKKYCESNG